MKFFSSLSLSCLLSLSAGPAALAQPAPSPYHTRFWVDAPITVGPGRPQCHRPAPGTAESTASATPSWPRSTKTTCPKSTGIQPAGTAKAPSSPATCCVTARMARIAPGLLALNPAVKGRYGQVASPIPRNHDCHRRHLHDECGQHLPLPALPLRARGRQRPQRQNCHQLVFRRPHGAHGHGHLFRRQGFPRLQPRLARPALRMGRRGRSAGGRPPTTASKPASTSSATISWATP
jgi:hypothetical protein